MMQGTYILEPNYSLAARKPKFGPESPEHSFTPCLILEPDDEFYIRINAVPVQGSRNRSLVGSEEESL